MKLELNKLEDLELWQEKRKREEEAANLSGLNNGGRQRELYLKLMGNIAKIEAEISNRELKSKWDLTEEY